MKKKVQLTPTQREALKWYAQGYKAEEIRDYAYALVCYKEVIKIEPTCGTHYLNRGNVYKKMGFNHHAIDDFRKAVELDPKLNRSVLNAHYRAS